MKTKKSVFDRIWENLRPLFKDEAAARKVMDEATAELAETEPEEDQHIHIHAGGRDEEAHSRIDMLQSSHDEMKGMIGAISEKLGIGDGATVDADEEEERKRKEAEAAAAGDAAAEEAQEEEMKEEAPAGTSDAAFKTNDSAILSDSFQETLALAEILVPGIKAPLTFDAKAKRKTTYDAICGLRRSAIDQAYKTDDGKVMIDSINGGRPLNLAKMHCRDVRTLFRAAGAMKKEANSRASRVGDTVVAAGGGLGIKGPIKSAADLNKRNAEIYGPRQSA